MPEGLARASRKTRKMRKCPPNRKKQELGTIIDRRASGVEVLLYAVQPAVEGCHVPEVAPGVSDAAVFWIKLEAAR